MKSTRLHCNALLLAGLLAPVGALAPLALHAEDTSAVSRPVSTGGTDLNTPAGAQVMYLRLKHAARAICSTSDPVEKAPSWEYRACMEEALARAIRQLHRPLLTQAFIGDYGDGINGNLGAELHVAKK